MHFVYCVPVNITPALLSERADARQCALLEAAAGVFARFGFRKASMDDIARAANVSRQGLYLSFSNKEELFRRTLEYALKQQLSAATAALARDGETLGARLIAACEAWSGRYVGMLGADSADLMCASTSLAGITLEQYENQFEDALACAIRASPLAGVCGTADVCPVQLARALHATARGLKQSCKTRSEFSGGMSAAVRMLCLPLDQPKARGK
jgi:AcrR family transcriptional regulator